MSEEHRPLLGNVSVQEYASIADQYESTFQVLPYRTYVEQASVLNVIGDVTGLRVLDVACGTGYYSRLWRQRGASQVVGVDISPEMVQAAQKIEAASPLGLTYLVRDVGTMEVLGTFDLVVGVYLLHYATTGEHLDQMCQCIAANLVSGGRFVTDTVNPAAARQPGYYEPYGMALYAHDDMVDGTEYSFAFTTTQGMISPLTIHYWTIARLEQALTKAGFTDICWQPAVVSAEGIRELGQEYWARHEAAPFCIILSATKQ